MCSACQCTTGTVLVTLCCVVFVIEVVRFYVVASTVGRRRVPAALTHPESCCFDARKASRTRG